LKALAQPKHRSTTEPVHKEETKMGDMKSVQTEKDINLAAVADAVSATAGKLALE
jgi:hypothetical protein